MKHHQIDDYTIIQVEKDIIKLGGIYKTPSQTIIPIGASAGMLHPVSGYSVGQTWRCMEDFIMKRKNPISYTRHVIDNAMGELLIRLTTRRFISEFLVCFFKLDNSLTNNLFYRESSLYNLTFTLINTIRVMPFHIIVFVIYNFTEILVTCFFL